MKIRISFLTILFMLAVCVSKAGKEIPFAWQGYIEVSQKMLAAAGSSSSGEVTTRWKLNINWKETNKNDIKDKSGKLVGQLIKLEDNGSAWEGSATGGFAQTSRDVVYSGQGSGANNAVSYGWIYYTLSDDDPLKDILPNGSYCVGANPGSAATFSETITYIDRRNGRSHSSTMPALLNYFIGGKNLCMPFGHLKGPDLVGPVSAETIKKCVTGGAQAMAAIQAANSWDIEARVIEDGVMKGHYSRTAFNGTLLNEISWDIKKVLEVSSVIEKADKNWRPTGSEEKNTIRITARVKDNTELKGKWMFTLFEVTKEKGIAMNKGKETDFDLEFTKEQSGFSGAKAKTDGWAIESTESKNEASVEIKSLDYGAWGKVKAKVNIEGNWYDCKAEDGKDYITIPFDDDSDRVADIWEENYGVKSENADADNDAEPKSKQDGDGFTNYEEYRGFFVNDQWKATDPKRKDLFVYDELGCGVSYFTKTGLIVQLIDKQEYDNKRIVNFNRGHATLKTQSGQKGLYLHEGALVGLWGETKPCVGTPNVVDEVIIDDISSYAKAAYLDRGTDGVFLKNYASTIAHELGHGVNILHHGEESWEVANGYDIARRGGIWSGDISCVMRYELPDRYRGVDGKYYSYPISEEGADSQTAFCSNNAGTGINAQGERRGADGNPYPVAADAERGNCKNNITLKGYNKWGN